LKFSRLHPWDFTIVLLTRLVYLPLRLSSRVSNSHARAFVQCHHFPSPIYNGRYLHRALSFCRMLCFNIAITVITLLPMPRAHPRTQQTNIRLGRSLLCSLRKPYTCEIPIHSAHGYPRFSTLR